MRIFRQPPGDFEKREPRISRIRADEQEVSHRCTRIHTDFQRGRSCSSVSICVHLWLFILVVFGCGRRPRWALCGLTRFGTGTEHSATKSTKTTKKNTFTSFVVPRIAERPHLSMKNFRVFRFFRGSSR